MKVDERSKQLLDLCISVRLRILNGRYTGDTYGKIKSETYWSKRSRLRNYIRRIVK